jgi:predicted N-formylglutamate amidohydrolase
VLRGSAAHTGGADGTGAAAGGERGSLVEGLPYPYRVRALIDVHSFPPDYTGFGEGVDVALLDDFAPPFQRYVEALLDRLQRAGLIVSTVVGRTNDIMVEARQDFCVPAVLVEFNESLVAHPARWDAALRAIREWATHDLWKYTQCQ